MAGVEHLAEYPPCGVHDFRTFTPLFDDFYPMMLRAFGRPTPTSFIYRRAAAQFSVWDWTFSADPARAEEFLEIKDASCAGFSLHGSGLETVTTAPCFSPYQRVRWSTGTSAASVVTPDATGRITVHVDLGPPHADQQYTPAAIVAQTAGGESYWTNARVSLTRVV